MLTFPLETFTSLVKSNWKSRRVSDLDVVSPEIVNVKPFEVEELTAAASN